MKLQLIGSMKENTKIFFPDELDIHLSLSSFAVGQARFDATEQKLYLNETEFPCKAYASFFFETIRTILDSIRVPKTFSMFPLNMHYSPCVHCMDMTNKEPQPKRCHHNKGCTIHASNQCDDSEDCPFECNCKNFTTPSISWSKIGAVLHFGKE